MQQTPRVTVLHEADFYHPHNDPDDHFDIACQYALERRRDIALGGFLLDARLPQFGDPAVEAIAQLNYLCTRHVPAGVGSDRVIRSAADFQQALRESGRNQNVALLLSTLQSSPTPVAVHIGGSSRDVALAAAAAPELFSANCAGIYLNAGSYGPESALEYNVALEPYTFARIFQIACPIYWMSPFEHTPTDGCFPFEPAPRATFFRFPQHDVLPYLSEGLQKYFLFMLEQEREIGWLSYLRRPVDRTRLEEFGYRNRNMWCLPGILHAAGLAASLDGGLVELDEAGNGPLYGFEPVAVDVREDGSLRWRPAVSVHVRMFCKRVEHVLYERAMVLALRTLLQQSC